MSEFNDNKPEAKQPGPNENALRNQAQGKDGPRRPQEQQQPQGGKPQAARDIYSMTQGDAGVGQGGGGGGEPLSHADLIPMPEKSSVANATARDTIDNQLFAAGMRRVTPMEITVNGQQFTGAVSHDRNGNRFITN